MVRFFFFFCSIFFFNAFFFVNFAFSIGIMCVQVGVKKTKERKETEAIQCTKTTMKKEKERKKVMHRSKRREKWIKAKRGKKRTQ